MKSYENIAGITVISSENRFEDVRGLPSRFERRPSPSQQAPEVRKGEEKVNQKVIYPSFTPNYYHFVNYLGTCNSSFFYLVGNEHASLKCFALYVFVIGH